MVKLNINIFYTIFALKTSKKKSSNRSAPRSSVTSLQELKKGCDIREENQIKIYLVRFRLGGVVKNSSLDQHFFLSD
jgi:hypothetical protein